MKKVPLMILLGTLAISGIAKENRVTVSNPLHFAREEMVEVPIKDTNMPKAANIRVISQDGRIVPSQITHDGLLIFKANVSGNSQVVYTLVPSESPLKTDTVACGKFYPDRDDDLAWENDVTAYRAYGPALQAKGQEGYGYDLFLKRGTSRPVLEQMYAAQLDPKNWAKVDSLRKASGEAAAREFENTFTYHRDQGYGLDCYAVGQSLGAGATAILLGDSIIYPHCYVEGEILDNGPLRFSARLTFQPTVVGTDTVIEERIITLDAGSNLNRTDIKYHGAKEKLTLATGIHVQKAKDMMMSGNRPYLSLIDPTQGDDNGELYIGIVFEHIPVEAISRSGKNDPEKTSHILHTNYYLPGDTFTYYWGYGWDRGNINNFRDWNNYLKYKYASISFPLKVEIE